MGTNSGAGATASLRSSYTGLRLAILVGMCGGVPRIAACDAFLGDVVVRKCFIQYDYGRQYPGHFSVKNMVEDSLVRVNKDIQGLLAVLETELMRERLQAEALEHLKQLQREARGKRRGANYRYPGTTEDRLYPSNHPHKHWTSCHLYTDSSGAFCEAASKALCTETACGSTDLMIREHYARDSNFRPEIYISQIGSQNIATKHNLIAFEMEGAGA